MPFWDQVTILLDEQRFGLMIASSDADSSLNAESESGRADWSKIISALLATREEAESKSSSSLKSSKSDALLDKRSLLEGSSMDS